MKKYMEFFRSLAILVSVSALEVGGNARAETIISTLGAWDGSNLVGSWGASLTPSYGQTFTAPNYSSKLTSMSFYMSMWSGDPQNYKFYLYNWEAGRPTGSPLFTSNVLTAPSSVEFSRVTINTDETVISPNTQYVGIISTLGLANSEGNYDFGFVGDDAYSDGNFVYSNDSSIDSGWRDFGSSDLAFEVTAISN